MTVQFEDYVLFYKGHEIRINQISSAQTAVRSALGVGFQIDSNSSSIFNFVIKSSAEANEETFSIVQRLGETFAKTKIDEGFYSKNKLCFTWNYGETQLILVDCQEVGS